jgi:hypothetical protein
MLGARFAMQPEASHDILSTTAIGLSLSPEITWDRSGHDRQMVRGCEAQWIML